MDQKSGGGEREKRMKVGIAHRLPYDIILGRDWPEFKKLVRETEGMEEYLEREDEENNQQDLDQEQTEDPKTGMGNEQSKTGKDWEWGSISH